jgi:hypothetical protein
MTVRGGLGLAQLVDAFVGLGGIGQPQGEFFVDDDHFPPRHGFTIHEYFQRFSNQSVQFDH